MKKNIIGVLVLIAFFALIVLISSNTDTSKDLKINSLVTVDRLSYDFGDIEIFAGKVSTTYTLKNEGTEDVSILSGITSCMCTEGEIGNLKFGMHGSSGETVIIPVGGEKILTATFDPLAHGPSGTGKIKREVILKTNSIITPEIEVTFSANVVKNETE